MPSLGRFTLAIASVCVALLVFAPAAWAGGGGDEAAFNKMDKDGDGQVSPAEREAFFKDADTNGDGNVDAEELKKAIAGEGEDMAGALMNLDFWTILITIVIFIILLIVLSKTAWKPILDALKKREETIAKALDDAKAANEAAQAKIEEYDAKIQTAKDEAQAIADEARKDAQDIRARIQADAQKESEAMVDRARREIDQLAATAWERVVTDAADVATKAAREIIQRDLSTEDHAEIVSKVITDYQASRQAGGA